MLLLSGCWSPSAPEDAPVIGVLADGDLDETVADDDEARDTGHADARDVVTPEAPALVLNEVVARNASTWDDGTGTFPDWVELYNASDETIALSRVMLRDGGGATWMGDDGEIAPGAVLLLAADRVTLPFALDGDDETLTLMVDGVTTDRLAIGQVDTDVAWARFPDGGAWWPTVWTTPGASNGDEVRASADPTDFVFQHDTFHEVHITLDADAVASLGSDRLTWVEGSVTLPEGTYARVGVRLKAYVGSSRTIDQKCGWKIDLNKYEDHSWHGLEGLTLNNMVQDYTYVHESLAYETFRAASVPAPRTAYAKVWLNDEYYGLYLLVESVDDRFLDRWYGDGSGSLYEGSYGVDLTTGNESAFEYDEGPDENDRADLTALIAAVQASPTDENLAHLEDLFDMDEFISNMAVEALITHWDGYTTANNYRLYDDPRTGRFTIIPWGTDQTFLGGYGPWDTGGELFDFCLANAACEARYDQRLLEVADAMDALALDDEATELESWLYDEIVDDPRREFGLPTHSAYLSETISFIQTYPDEVRELVDER